MRLGFRLTFLYLVLPMEIHGTDTSFFSWLSGLIVFDLQACLKSGHSILLPD